MFIIKGFAILFLISAEVSGISIFGSSCKGQCGQGEGDCDNDRDCLPGLICDYDYWFDTDYCKAGNRLTLNSETIN